MDIQVVQSYINELDLFQVDAPILVGLSGGADSIALAHVLHTLGYPLIAAHCNFHLRDEESNRDEKFVVDFCNMMNIELVITHFNTYQFAEKNKLSIEMAARQLRYDWFEQVRREKHCKYIAIAHHRDDNVETLILNLLRGTGLKGLTAIQPINGLIRRPLLQISREEIICYLDENKQQYVTDSTNLESDFARNKVRLDILPLMREINSACSDNIQNTIQYLNDVQDIYKRSINQSVSKLCKNNSVSIPDLLQEPGEKTVLYEICSLYGFNSKQVNDIFQVLKTPEKKLFYSKDFTLTKSRDFIFFHKNNDAEVNNSSPTLTFTTVPNNESLEIVKDGNTAYFDADLIDIKKLNFRKWNTGDYFVPFGMKGKKNISDFYTDLKYTEIQKKKQWLLLHNEDIIWVVGKRSDNRYRITKNTKNVVIIYLENQEQALR